MAGVAIGGWQVADSSWRIAGSATAARWSEAMKCSGVEKNKCSTTLTLTLLSLCLRLGMAERRLATRRRMRVLRGTKGRTYAIVGERGDVKGYETGGG